MNVNDIKRMAVNYGFDGIKIQVKYILNKKVLYFNFIHKGIVLFDNIYKSLDDLKAAFTVEYMRNRQWWFLVKETKIA
jgi:hypothetical protein